MRAASPGQGCCCTGKGGLGNLLTGSCSLLPLAGDAAWFWARAGATAAAAARPPATVSRCLRGGVVLMPVSIRLTIRLLNEWGLWLAVAARAGKKGRGVPNRTRELRP